MIQAAVLESMFHYFISCMTLLLTYLSLSFLSCKMGILVPTSQSDCEEHMRQCT